MDCTPSYSLYACVPFVALEPDTSLVLGPVVFWPASYAREMVVPADYPHFNAYLQKIAHIQAKAEEEKEWHLAEAMCISISDAVALPDQKDLLIDALYLLYFSCAFQNLYYGNEVPSFQIFKKLIPADPLFFRNTENWEQIRIEAKLQDSPICIHLAGNQICAALGKALSLVYLSSEHPASAQCNRLIRSIRYLVDRYFPPFINLFNRGLELPEALFEPEEIVFLASGFEALFDLNEQKPAADFKHKLRSLLHLKYAKPLECFWLWVDDFYDAKKRIIHGGENPDPLFRGNPNFEISHLLIGVKLFVYAVCYRLHELSLIDSTREESSVPPDFQEIHPEEVILFFWSEKAVLQQLLLCLRQLERSATDQDLQKEAAFLASLYISMTYRYFLQPARPGICFKPTPAAELVSKADEIRQRMQTAFSLPAQKGLLADLTAAFNQRFGFNWTFDKILPKVQI